MYLSKLEIHGFKSFAERTVLNFHPGITAIVGPNGCGKSNVVDAVRWVIGEQRARILRSEKMENVIFNGTARKRPLGLAEVMLTIENTRGILPLEYTEVTLGRRLYRSGESEYLLNGVKCRLQDILDLFMDTGMGAGAYSVIELKMIEEILSENAQDRRRLFEEAAGITKYKLRRKQALGKLGDTQADLTRINDLTDEIGKQVRTLKRQAERAVKFKEYDDRLREVELSLARAEYDRLEARQGQLRAEIETLRGRTEDVSKQLAHEEGALDEARKELSLREQNLARHRSRLGAHRESVRTLESDLRLERERQDAYQRDLSRLLGELDEAGARSDALREAVARMEQELAAEEPALHKAAEALKAAEEERDRTRAATEELRRRAGEIRREQEQQEQALTARRRQQDRVTSRIEILSQERARYHDSVQEAAAAGQDLEERLRQGEAGVAESAEARDKAGHALDQAAAVRETNRQALDAADDALRQTERRREAVAAELNLLESLMLSYEAFAGPVQYLASAPEWTAEEVRTVADVLTCPPEIRPALESALGEYASCLVVETEAETRQAIEMLRAHGQGQAVFIVLEHLRPASPTAPPAGGFRPLAEAVEAAAPAYRLVADVLLRDCYLAASLEDARAAAADAEGRFIAPTGEWAASPSLLKGGSADPGASPMADRLNRREQRDAARRMLDELDAVLANRRQNVERLTAERLAVPYDALREALAQAQRAAADAERLLDRVLHEQETARKRREDAASRLTALEQELAGLRTEEEGLSQQLKEADASQDEIRRRRADADEAYQEADALGRAALARFNTQNIAAVQVRNRVDNLRRDYDRTRQELDALAKRSASREEDILNVRRQMQAAHNKTASIERKIADVGTHRPVLETAVQGAEADIAQTRAAIAAIEANLRRFRQEREAVVRDEHERDLRLAEIHTRVEDLTANILEHFGISLPDEPLPLGEDFDEQAARREVQDLRAKIKGLGPVNALALEDYEKDRERYDFLTAQQQDLQSAETSLLHTIEEINTTASDRFNETYQAILANFKRIFEDLFGEDAAANLELADPADLLESPIEIMAKPRGKRPSTIAQLSGGEKTLTAIALLFAIYLVKPSPFCILDEVDAPLDDANVGRFMHLIREFSRSTQFILVTHNKRTMELADRMYGITMQEQGVSKLVGVAFSSLTDPTTT